MGTNQKLQLMPSDTFGNYILFDKIWVSYVFQIHTSSRLRETYVPVRIHGVSSLFDSKKFKVNT
jgi:hypothetical protein